MANIIKHQGIVENIDGTHIQVKIVQASACASCSARRHCTSADVKEKLIDVTDSSASDYQVGDKVWVMGQMSMGTRAILYAFVIPFFIIVISLFAFIFVLDNELYAALISLTLLFSYYYILRLNRERLARNFMFFIRPMDNE